MSEKYDVIAVGMGPSSIFMAYELIKLKKAHKVFKNTHIKFRIMHEIFI